MQFDLKLATVSFIDGYSEAGAVNLMAGYIAGVTTMAIDAITGLIPVGSTFTKTGGDGTVYTIASQSATLGNTTSITFTPGLTEAFADDAVLVFGGRRLQIKVGDGNVSFDEMRAIEYKKDRGRLDTTRLGDEEPMDVKLDLRWEFIKSDSGDPGSIPSPVEVLRQSGAASAWTSSETDDPCAPYAIDILIDFDPEVCANVKTEQILLPAFRYEKLSYDLKQGTLSCTGKCNATAATTSRV
jgi:hypothetical protein